MSREQYTPTDLTAAGSSSQTQQTTTAAQDPFVFRSDNFEDTTRPVSYLCGDCDAKVQLKKGDAIRCKECGYRVLYKERTNRMIQFEAR